MRKYKVGDRIRVKKLFSEQKYSTIIENRYEWKKGYSEYKRLMTPWIGYEGKVEFVCSGSFYICIENCSIDFCDEEVEKIGILSDKIKVLKKLMK